MSEMTYIHLYLDQIHTLAPLPDAARGRLVLAMLHYAVTGEEQRLTGPARILWPLFRNQIDRDREKYRAKCEKNRMNGMKGGRPRQKPNGFEKSQEEEKEKEKGKGE